jgi:hypothetical protein
MKTQKIAKEKGIEDLFFADLEMHSIRFAKWISKYGYEKVFKGKKGWITYFGIEDYDDKKCTRYSIKELYDKFMIDYLCS